MWREFSQVDIFLFALEGPCNVMVVMADGPEFMKNKHKKTSRYNILSHGTGRVGFILVLFFMTFESSPIIQHNSQLKTCDLVLHRIFEGAYSIQIFKRIDLKIVKSALYQLSLPLTCSRISTTSKIVAYYLLIV